MKIAYVTMQFPAPSETFASTDIRALQSLGHEVEVFCLRSKHKKHNEMMRDRKHASLFVSAFDLYRFIKFIKMLVRRPDIIFTLLLWIVRCCLKSREHLIKSVALVPSVV